MKVGRGRNLSLASRLKRPPVRLVLNSTDAPVPATRLQKSADLQSWQDWQDFSTYRDTIGFTDPPPPPGTRTFYRALELSR